MQDKIYKRAIKATLHRNKGRSTAIVWERFFSSVTKAMTRGVELALLDGEPGDVLEITSSNFGYAIATVKLGVSTKGLTNIKIEFLIEEEVK